MRIDIQETLNGRYFWTLTAPSGQILARSWVDYTERRSARRGARRVASILKTWREEGRPAVACALPGE